MSSHGNDGTRLPQPRSDKDHSHNDNSRGTGNKETRNYSDPATVPDAQAPFPIHGRYKLLGDPIAGGMGVVFRALDLNLDIEVAIKRIRAKYAADKDLIRRFEREAKVQVRLKHPHLVQVRDYAKDEFGPYIVMDWIEGQSLAAAIDANGPFEWRQAATLISKVAYALQVAHEAGIVHRDVKPGNILLDAKGEPYITDFGLARIETTQSAITETATNAMLGTINYASPEQQKNPRNACDQSDIWSLGATLYTLLTGHDVLGMRESLIPEPLRAIVLKATERSVKDRYSTMRQFSEELLRVIPGTTSKTTVEKQYQADDSENIERSNAAAAPSLLDRWKHVKEQVEQTTTKAQSIAEKQQDYVAAADLLETIPEHLRNANVYAQIIKRRDRVSELDMAINKAIENLQSTGLRELVSELLKLQPRRKELEQLLAELPENPAADTKSIEDHSVLPHPNKGSRPALLVSPFDGQQAKAAQKVWAKYLGIRVEVKNGLGMKFRVIPPGTFEMGSPSSEAEREEEEEHQHTVTITQPKLLSVYPVTQGEWMKLMGSNPSDFKHEDEDTSRFPVEQVTWDDSQEFLEELNAKHGLKGWRYRLPTEAEWEYACRAGTVTPFGFGGKLYGNQANCDGNSPYPNKTIEGPFLNFPCDVGRYGANPFGLYDQHGNVWEWCQDWYDYYDLTVSEDPTGAASGSSRVMRGGSWYSNAAYCRSASRSYYLPGYPHGSVGFRVLCELV